MFPSSYAWKIILLSYRTRDNVRNKKKSKAGKFSFPNPFFAFLTSRKVLLSMTD